MKFYVLDALGRLACEFRRTKDLEERGRIICDYHRIAARHVLPEYPGPEDMLPDEYMPALNVNYKEKPLDMEYQVVAYLQAGITYAFPARNQTHAREISNRIITEGLWVISPDGEPEGTELFFPTHLIAKVKAFPANKA